MKRKLTTLGVVACLALALAPSAWGDIFVVPPENTATALGPWSTPFPYQRNIFIDFLLPPAPPDPAGIPGAVYEGTLDPLLRGSDFYTVSNGAVQQPDVIVMPPGGQVTLHIDNLDNAQPVKHLYAEMVANGALTVNVASTAALTGFATDTARFWAQLQPNPAWEDIILTNQTGALILLQSVHVATECVPVPAAVLLGMLGLGVAGMKLRKHV